jgi:hypothetical protein
MYLKGFWLILIEDDGAEMAVACQILSQDETKLVIRAHIPPSWYPQTFTGFKVRQDGKILGWRRLPSEAPIQVPAHAGFSSVDLDFIPTAAAGRPGPKPSRERMAVPTD